MGKKIEVKVPCDMCGFEIPEDEYEFNEGVCDECFDELDKRSGEEYDSNDDKNEQDVC